MSRGLQGCVGTDNDAVQREDLEEGTKSCCLLDRGWLECCRVEFRVGALKISIHPPANYYGAALRRYPSFGGVSSATLSVVIIVQSIPPFAYTHVSNEH